MSRDKTSEEYEDLKIELRSLLISSKDGCTEQQLIKDYAAFVEQNEIPFRQMGYKSLIELLTSMPDVARIDQTRIPIKIFGVADSATKHIDQFVKSQRRKRKTRYPPKYVQYTRPNYFTQNATYQPNYNNNYFPTGIPFQPYSQLMSNQKIPRNINNVPNLQTPLNLNQILTKPVASFPPKVDLIEPPNSSIIDDDSNDYDDYEAELTNRHGEKIILLRKRIRQLLLKYSQGIWLTNIQKLYQKSFNEDLNLEEYKLKNLLMLFDCISDFVNSLRDRRPGSTDRILLLKEEFIEETKNEQEEMLEQTNILSTLKDDDNSSEFIKNDIEGPSIDLSSFVLNDFHFNRIEFSSSEPFTGFLGDVVDPWNLRIGNVEFIEKRERMMVQLQDYYNKTEGQSIYKIPMEQIEINLPCVYYHRDKKYYRSFICNKFISENGILSLEIDLVDYGLIIPDVNYHINSTNLKYLHQNFSSLPTQIYNCRLAHIFYPSGTNRWSNQLRELIIDFCDKRNFLVQVVGFFDSMYCVYLWNNNDQSRSLNEFLIKNKLVSEFDDTQNSKVQTTLSNFQTNNNENNNYLDEKLFDQSNDNDVIHDRNENSFKQFRISIDHAYYFIKHPFTRRPCLPCFEIARLLNINENEISKLNLIRKCKIDYKTYEVLLEDLRCLPESKTCPHINRNADTAMIEIYDLSSINDYLKQNSFREGDVIDAFDEEFSNSDRPGYWNENKDFYKSQNSSTSYQNDLYEQRNHLNIRKEQLNSLPKTSRRLVNDGEMNEIEQRLIHIDERLHLPERTPPSNVESLRLKLSRKKMRETRCRIANPFDKQFSLNLCFNHQFMKNNQIEDIEEYLQDLHRITMNVIVFFVFEPGLIDGNQRLKLDELDSMYENLIQIDIPLDKRIETYNYCLKHIIDFQSIIRTFTERTDLFDAIY